MVIVHYWIKVFYNDTMIIKDGNGQNKQDLKDIRDAMDYVLYLFGHTGRAAYAREDCYKLIHHYSPILQQPSGSVTCHVWVYVCVDMGELVHEYNQ